MVVPFREFKRGVRTETTSDFFDAAGLFAYYDHNDLCNAIEMGFRSRPLFMEQELIGKKFSEVREWLETLDSGLKLNDAGLTSVVLGIGIYAPSCSKDSMTRVEGLIAFTNGYYGRK